MHGRESSDLCRLLGGRILSDARHVTSLDANSDALRADSCDIAIVQSRAARCCVRQRAWHWHGQNDLFESRGIRAAFGRAANSVCVSANKAMLGHLVNASGSVELAITAIALAMDSPRRR